MSGLGVLMQIGTSFVLYPFFMSIGYTRCSAGLYLRVLLNKMGRGKERYNDKVAL